jgi:hypothetical protein
MDVGVDPFLPVHRRRDRRRFALLVALLTAALVTALVVQQVRQWDSTSITEVWVTSESELAVYGHCSRSARVQVDATASAVVLDLQTRGESCGDCLDRVVVQLDEELGDRALIDARTDAPVPALCAADGSSCRPPTP